MKIAFEKSFWKFIFGGRTETRCLRDIGFEALQVVSDSMTALGYKNHVDFGTLLGFIRAGDFISYDLDVDYAVYEDCDFRALRDELKSRGMKFLRGFTYDGIVTEITMAYKRVSIDFFKNYLNGDDQYYYLYGRFDKKAKFPHRTKQAVKCMRPAVIAVKTERIAGLADVSMPLNAQDLLERAYGKNWRIPDPSWEADLDDGFRQMMPILGKKIKKL